MNPWEQKKVRGRERDSGIRTIYLQSCLHKPTIQLEEKKEVKDRLK